MASATGLVRYEKFRAGKSLQEIAQEEDVCVETVRASVREEKVRRNLELREEVEQRNNRLRRRAQRELEDELISALRKLLRGQKEIPFSISGGKIITKLVSDPKALMLGIEQYRKTVSLEEKPVQAPTTVVNVQQNNVNRSSAEDFEERIKRLKKAQQERMVQETIEVKPESPRTIEEEWGPID